MSKNRGYTFYKQNAEHLLALGTSVVWLDETDEDLPWGLVASCEEGGANRGSRFTAAHVKAPDPSCGIIFEWNAQLESLTGSQIEADAAKCAWALQKLAGNEAGRASLVVLIARLAQLYFDDAQQMLNESRRLSFVGGRLLDVARVE